MKVKVNDVYAHAILSGVVCFILLITISSIPLTTIIGASLGCLIGNILYYGIFNNEFKK
jgi:hypothetical protein